MGLTLTCHSPERDEAGTRNKEGSSLEFMWGQGANPHIREGDKAYALLTESFSTGHITTEGGELEHSKKGRRGTKALHPREALCPYLAISQRVAQLTPDSGPKTSRKKKKKT